MTKLTTLTLTLLLAVGCRAGETLFTINRGDATVISARLESTLSLSTFADKLSVESWGLTLCKPRATTTTNWIEAPHSLAHRVQYGTVNTNLVVDVVCDSKTNTVTLATGRLKDICRSYTDKQERVFWDVREVDNFYINTALISTNYLITQ